MKVDTKSKIFTWLYRVFCYLVPSGFALWSFLIETLIKDDVSVLQKIGCTGLFVLILMVVIAIFFYGKHLKKKITALINDCIECIDNEKKIELVAKKKKFEAKQELFRNACFIAPFIVAWLIVSLVEKQVVSLRGTLMIVSSSMATGLGFNGVAKWIKTKGDKHEKE